MKITKSIVAILCFFSFTSCLNPAVDDFLEDTKYADIVLFNADYYYSKAKSDPVHFIAKKVKIYTKSNKVSLEGTEFELLGENKKMKGKMDRADVNLSNNMATLRGNVKIDIDDGNEIDCESVEWNSQNDIMRATGSVKVKYNNLEFDCNEFNGSLRDGTFTLNDLSEGWIKENKDVATPSLDNSEALE